MAVGRERVGETERSAMAMEERDENPAEPSGQASGQEPRRRYHWNQQYYDNMAFHFWEPHHIGRTRNPESPIRTEAKAIAKLRGLETILNHQMELFFRLAPNDLVQGLFVSAFGPEFTDSYCVIGREYHRTFAVEGVTQPDLLFEGTFSVAAIELKLGAKTSLEQIVKYAALFTLMPPARRAYGLLLMGPKSFPNLWRGKYQTVADLCPALMGFDRSIFSNKLQRYLERNGPAVEVLLPQIKIGFLNYRDFYTMLANEFQRGPHHETYQRLLAGMMAELEERGLAHQLVTASTEKSSDDKK